MAYRDLRSYLAALEERGKLKRVRKEVDKDWEIYAVGLETDTVEGINRKWDQALEKPIPPRIVKSGPCKENILMGDKVDIRKLPVPIWTVGEDPGPFFTSPYVITKDPETGVRNVGTYRMEVKGPNKTGFLIGKVQDAAWHLRKNNTQNKPTPVAVVIGADPSIGYVSRSEEHTSELQ